MRRFKIRVIESAGCDYVAEVPDDIRVEDISDYIDDGIALGVYDFDPIRDSDGVEEARVVKIIEELGTEEDKLCREIDKAILEWDAEQEQMNYIDGGEALIGALYLARDYIKKQKEANKNV